MKNIFKSLIVVAFLALTPVASQAQVVMKEFLSQDHSGQVDKSVNNGGKPLYYKFEYKSTEGMRINYTLYIYKDTGMKSPMLTLPVLMRNLTWTYYVDITFTKDNTSKIAALIFKKDLRWSRAKFTPHEGCANVNPIVWQRYNMVDNYDALIKDYMTQIDKNINLNCYSGAMTMTK